MSEQAIWSPSSTSEESGVSVYTTDEQKFVGLLLATKLMREEDDLLRIFNASLPFVRRMMMTPSSEAANPYRALALSVLASFGASAHVPRARESERVGRKGW